MVPPFVGLAVKVSAVPEQDGFAPEVSAMDTDGVTVGLTVILILLEVAGLPITPERLDVITQVTTCPLLSEEVVYVALLVPTFVPFTFH